MSGNRPKKWFITGVSTGLGRDIMNAALAQGDIVVGTLRNMKLKPEIEALAPGRAFAIQLDVDDVARTKPAVDEAAKLLGGEIDILVNNAGFAIYGPVELCSPDDYRRVMETNFFGTVRVTQAALPLIRASKGMIINLSSIAGFVGNAGTSTYNSSKFAVEGFSEALAEEMAAFGVKVMIVSPDAFKSEFFTGREAHMRLDDNSVYAGKPGGSIGQQLDTYVGHEPGDPVKLAKLVVKAVKSDNPPFRLVVGAWGMQSVGAKLDRVKTDLDAWRTESEATGFDKTGSIGWVPPKAGD
jgi:NAD(P)-dependent dehydrogenase (short-subunit alcohol dehydrogenase family)